MKLYTTGQVSRICNVATSTVNKWFDSGKLKGFRVPGSRHRRIPRDSLIEFLKQYDVPVEALENEGLAKVLIVARDPALIDPLKREMPPARSFKVAVARSPFEAGFQAETFRPDCVVVDFAIGEKDARQICRNLRNKSRLAQVVLIALLPDGPRLQPLELRGVTEWFQRPFDPALLAERIRTLVGATKDLA